MQFPEDDVSAVAAEKLRLGLLNGAHLIGIADDELSGFERRLFRVRSLNSAPFNCGMADAIAESERFFLGRQGVAILSPDRLNPLHIGVSSACTYENFFKPFLVGRNRHQNHMQVCRSKGRLPMLGTAFTG